MPPANFVLLWNLNNSKDSFSLHFTSCWSFDIEQDERQMQRTFKKYIFEQIWKLLLIKRYTVAHFYVLEILN